MKRIKNYWLNQQPPALSQHYLTTAKYLLFDGTYFHKKGCLALVIDIEAKRILQYQYIQRESYQAVYPLFLHLKNQGLSPLAITLDGHRMVIRAILEVWPQIRVQRCLFHIQNQGMMWIRYRPKTVAGQTLRNLLKTLAPIRSQEDRDCFVANYQSWHQTYDQAIRLLPKDCVASKDLRRTVSLINNALPDMFHFIKDQKVATTTNYLENFYSQLKHQYRNHRGLSEQHKVHYLKWFCYLKNKLN